MEPKAEWAWVFQKLCSTLSFEFAHVRWQHFEAPFVKFVKNISMEILFAPFPHHPPLSFSSPWSGLTSSNTHPLSPNRPPRCPISQLRGRGQDIPRGLRLPPMGSSADSARALVQNPGDRSRERRTGSSGAPGRSIVGRRTWFKVNGGNISGNHIHM